jgi:O-antigen/teichoic acid export membrane protein
VPKLAATHSAKGNIIRMTAGTVMVGLSGYVFLTFIGHDRFDSAVTAALTSTYLLTNIVGPGVFLAVEQETSRTLSDRIARELRARGPIRRMAVVAGALAVLMTLITTLAAPVLMASVLEKNGGLLAAILLTIFGSALVFLVRGIVGGRADFGRYSTSLLLDGGVRIGGCLVLAFTGNTNPAAYGLTLALGPIAAAAFVGGALLRPASGAAKAARKIPEASPTAHGDLASPTVQSDLPSWTSLTRAVVWLLVSSVLTMAIANLAPVMVKARMPEAPAVAAGFAVALVLTRIPLLLMLPVQAMLLPRMARAVAVSDQSAFRKGLTRGILGVLGAGLATVAGSAAIGSWVISLLFGSAMDTTSAPALALLAASTGLLMVIQLLQPALVALRRSDGLVLGWIAGAVCFLAILFVIPIAPLTAAISAQIAGPLVTLAVHATVLRIGISRVWPARMASAR